jgi:NADPH2:quinone reductase
MKAIRLEAYGGPEQLKLDDGPDPAPGPGEALVQVSAAGINFMDIGVRTRKFWPDKAPPFTLGVEGAGRVLGLGEGVDKLRIGDRVAWFYVRGSYAQQIVAPADTLVPIPDVISDETAASLMMQGLTASHFVTEVYAIKPGDIALVHAAAGGVGLLLTQMIKLRGGMVIGGVSSASKVEVARAAGADHVIVESGGTFVEQVIRLTDGEGVHVVYDVGGGGTFADSLGSLRYHGVLAYFGVVVGGLAPLDLASLPRSVLVTYPTVGDHVRTREALLSRSQQLFAWVESGQLEVSIGHRYKLADAAQAHRDIASRRTTGKLLLIP